MKNILKTTILAFFVISLGSCETDNTNPVATANGITLKTMVPSGPYVLSPLDGNDNGKPDDSLATFTWTVTDNGVASIPSSYVIEIAKSGTNFAKPIAASPSSTKPTYIWTESYLDPILLENGFIPDVAADIDIRIKSTLGLGSFPLIQYSNVFSATVTPFAQPSFAFTKEGTNPAEAPKLISSSLFTTDCEGYAWLEAGSYKFYTAIQSVYQTSNPFYGDNGSGALELNGNTINVATAGFYLIKADTNLKTYSVTLTQWGIFGGATPFPSEITNANSKKMTYNSATKKWEMNVALGGGKGLRFGNLSLSLILGEFDATRVGPDYAGTEMSYNIKLPPVNGKPVPDSGQPGIIMLPGTTLTNYKITLDLNTPRAYTYTLEIQ